MNINSILKILKKEYPLADTSLNFKNPLQILIATILSAQCTDTRVNIVTKSLFKKYKTAKDYANASQEEFEQDIRSTGFYKNKTKNIIATANILQDKYKGKVPKTMEQLIELKGVARKTANIVLSEGYGITEGMAIDRHCQRILQRLNLTKNKDPNKIEQDMIKLLPKEEWADTSFRLVLHGRKYCKSQKPLCTQCPLEKLCPKIKIKK